MIRAGLLCLALACAAGAQPPQRTAEDVQRELERVMEAQRPLVEKLRALAPRYPAASDFSALERERAALLKELGELNLRYSALDPEFQSLRKTQHMVELQTLLSGRRPADMGAKLTRALSLETFEKEAREFRAARGSVAKEDADAFTAAKDALGRKALILRWSAGIAAVLLIPLGLFAFRGAARSPRPASGQGALSAAAGAAAALPRSSGRSEPAAGLSAPADSLSAPAAAPPAGASLPPGSLALGPSPGLPPGTLLGGNFRVISELGRGGMGLVYEATDVTLNRRVAVKKMREELLRDPRELEMFLSEARLVAALQHPYIVKIHGAVREDPQLYLVFEFVSGRPLHRVIEQQGRLGLRAIEGILSHAAAAVDYAHSQKVVHRDLKPSNIMVTDDGIAKVMDFGLAYRAQASAARLSKAGSWGSPMYMAPEQELGEGTPASDAFSLGACVYEMAVGRAPFTGPNFLAQKRERVFALPSQAAGLPPTFDRFILKALDPDPAGRFRSGAEMLAALSSIG